MYQFSILADLRLGQALLAFGIVRGKATFITDPNLVHFFILTRHDALHHNITTSACFTACVQRGVATHRALCTDRSLHIQFPWARFKAEICSRQRADRANVSGIARENRIKSGVRKRDDLSGACTFIETGHRVACDFILKTDTTRTLNAAFLIQNDEVTERHVFAKPQLFIINKATLARSICHGEILQGALATFIADRTIERMRGKQKFNGTLLPFGRFRRLCNDHHTLFHFICTSGFELGHKLDFRRAVLHHELTGGAIADRTTNLHEAHAAHTDRLKFGMMTKDRDININHLGGIRHHESFGDGYLFSINCKRDLFTHCAFTALSKSDRKRSIPVTTAMVENSPNAHRHLPCICFATLSSRSTSVFVP